MNRPPLPYEFDEAAGTRLLHIFLRLKAIVGVNADLKLYISPEFLSFVRTRLNVKKCTTLTGKVVTDLVRIDTVDLHVDKNSSKPFYIYY